MHQIVPTERKSNAIRDIASRDAQPSSTTMTELELDVGNNKVFREQVAASCPGADLRLTRRFNSGTPTITASAAAASLARILASIGWSEDERVCGVASEYMRPA